MAKRKEIETAKLADVPKLISHARQASGYSYPDLSVVTGMSVGQLWRLENGVIGITTRQLQVLARAFNEEWVVIRIAK